MTLSFDELVSPRLLDVPDYQRGYAWEGEHLREFWEDLDLIEPGRRHYTGTVVLRDRGKSLLDQEREVPLEHFDVVDGQQRLTTCALLLDRVYDHLEALHDGDVPGERRRLLTAVIDGVGRPKLQLGADLREYWQRVILDGKPQVDGSLLAAQRRLSQAAEFAEDRLAEARTQHPDDSAYRTWLRRLAGKVTSALQFTLYVVDNDSDVGLIFETLNQRGKELTELEKTKNYLLYLANLLDVGPRQQLAAAINESWRTIFVNLGSAQALPSSARPTRTSCCVPTGWRRRTPGSANGKRSGRSKSSFTAAGTARTSCCCSKRSPPTPTRSGRPRLPTATWSPTVPRALRHTVPTPLTCASVAASSARPGSS